MRFWARLTQKYRKDSNEGRVVLSRAYRAVFRGDPSKAQQDMVLSDLAASCGFYMISPEDTDPYVQKYREGKRAAFAEIFSHLSLGPEEMTALENAARRDAYGITDNELYAQ